MPRLDEKQSTQHQHILKAGTISLNRTRVVPYDIPRRSIAGYYPECNVLIPLWHFAEGSKVPASKSIPVRISRDAPLEYAEAEEIPISAK